MHFVKERSGDDFVRTFKERYCWWDVYLTGIRPPVYDGYTASGLTFAAIDPLFSNLVHVPKGSTVKVGIYKKMPDLDEIGSAGHYRESIYCPTAFKLLSLPISVDIAVKGIDTYLRYKERIEEALNKFESIYGIDKSTGISKMSKEYKKLHSLPYPYEDEYFKLRDEIYKKYPNPMEIMNKLITEFRLDFVKKWR